MRIELWIFFITIAILYDTYHNHIYSKKIFSYKKYIKIITIASVALCFYFFVKKHPSNTCDILNNVNNCIKYLPIDKTTSSIITSGSSLLMTSPSLKPDVIMTQTNDPDNKITTKRSVSETKKKYVAYSQEWKCNFCGKVLDHTYEIDHKVELRNGGTNETTNLVDLCAGCHRLKTASNYL